MKLEKFGRGFLIMLATGIAAAAAFYVLQKHWAHALGFAPYLLFLACPLMHVFMHGNHQRKSGTTQRAPRQNTSAVCH